MNLKNLILLINKITFNVKIKETLVKITYHKSLF